MSSVHSITEMNLLDDRASLDSEPEREPVSSVLVTGLIILYLFWVFTTPQHSSRLAFLADIRFEKILAISLIILTTLRGRIENLFKPTAMAVLALFAWMLIADLFSSFPDYPKAIHWRENYWKKIVFFAVIAIGLKNISDLRVVFLGFVYVIAFYQFYSWFDFVRGGSYVYQQGMKRMVGTWTTGGIGDANGYGFLAAFSLPFIYYYYRQSNSMAGKVFAMIVGAVSMMSIIYSGTRGALLVAVLYLAFKFRARLLRPSVIIPAVLVAVMMVPMLPEKIKHRYWDLFINANQMESDSKTDMVAIKSGKDRIQGMKDGFSLASIQPIFGFGPGNSPKARVEVLNVEQVMNLDLELHNLYGQLAADLGYIGFGLWMMMAIAFLVAHRSLRRSMKYDKDYLSALEAAHASFWIMVTYGMFNHSAYGGRLLFVLGIFVALQSAHAYEKLNVDVDEDEWEFDDGDDEDWDSFSSIIDQPTQRKDADDN